MKKHLIVIAGPTAVGKTSLSIELAKHYLCPVISADSRQFYKEMNIGTAKPTTQEMQDVPHYFINNISIHDSFTVGDYEKQVIETLEDLFNKHQYVILVGGSGLYINAVLNGFDEFEEIPDSIRTALINNYKEKGLSYLQEELKKRDETYYNQVDLNNSQRLIRALEVCIHSGLPYSSFRTKSKKERSFNTIPILINTNRELLYKRINHRVDEMMKKGLLKEVKSLYLFKQLNALNTVGYKELFTYLDDNCSLEEAISQIKQNSRRYAKRQLTWFNHQGNFECFGPDDFHKITAYIDIVTQHS